MRTYLWIALAATILSACKEDLAELPDPVPLTEEAVSFFCQMSVLEHGGPKAQIHLDGQPAPIFFAQVRDAVAYLVSPERDAQVIATYVSDMGAASSWNDPGIENWILADDALFVIESGVSGGMGAPEVVPFADAAKAQEFVRQFGGRALGLTEIPEAAVTGFVDPELLLETPS